MHTAGGTSWTVHACPQLRPCGPPLGERVTRHNPRHCGILCDCAKRCGRISHVCGEEASRSRVVNGSRVLSAVWFRPFPLLLPGARKRKGRTSTHPRRDHACFVIVRLACVVSCAQLRTVLYRKIRIFLFMLLARNGPRRSLSRFRSQLSGTIAHRIQL